MTDINEAMKMLREGKTVELTEHKEEVSPHWNTCTHRMDDCELVKEAEQVAIFHDDVKHVTHVSIHDENWFSCTVLPCIVYDELTEDEQIRLIDSEMRFLRSLRE